LRIDYLLTTLKFFEPHPQHGQTRGEVRQLNLASYAQHHLLWEYIHEQQRCVGYLTTAPQSEMELKIYNNLDMFTLIYHEIPHFARGRNNTVSSVFSWTCILQIISKSQDSGLDIFAALSKQNRATILRLPCKTSTMIL